MAPSTGPSCRAAAMGPTVWLPSRTRPAARQAPARRPVPSAAAQRRTGCCSPSRARSPGRCPPAGIRAAAGSARPAPSPAGRTGGCRGGTAPHRRGYPPGTSCGSGHRSNPRYTRPESRRAHAGPAPSGAYGRRSASASRCPTRRCGRRLHCGAQSSAVPPAPARPAG